MCAKHSSIEAVDLMTVVIRALAERGMTVNVISEFDDGHLFVLGGEGGGGGDGVGQGGGGTMGKGEDWGGRRRTYTVTEGLGRGRTISSTRAEN